MASRKIQTYQIKAKNLCTIPFLRLTWTVNANLLKQNIIVIKEICSWLPPFCKQNLHLFIQPRWQLRRTYFFLRTNSAVAALVALVNDITVNITILKWRMPKVTPPLVKQQELLSIIKDKEPVTMAFFK